MKTMISKVISLLAVSTLVLLGFFVQSMNAQILEDRNFAVGINAGTNGFGGELTTNVTNKFNARIGFNLLNVSENGSYDDEDPGLDYNADLGVSNFSALVDFFPMNRGFKLTAGFYYYNFEVTGDAIPNENYIMNEGRDNEKVFTPERLGSLAVRLEYPNKFMPYIGLGFGNAISPKGIPVKFNMQLGMLYSGAPELAMTGTGMIAPTVDQAPNIQAGLNAFEWLPVINLGLSVRIK